MAEDDKERRMICGNCLLDSLPPLTPEEQAQEMQRLAEAQVRSIAQTMRPGLFDRVTGTPRRRPNPKPNEKAS